MLAPGDRVPFLVAQRRQDEGGRPAQRGGPLGRAARSQLLSGGRPRSGILVLRGLRAELAVKRGPNGRPLLDPGHGANALDRAEDRVSRLVRVGNLAEDDVAALSGRLDDQIAELEEVREEARLRLVDVLDHVQRGLCPVLADDEDALLVKHALVRHDVVVVEVIDDQVSDGAQGDQRQYGSRDAQRRRQEARVEGSDDGDEQYKGREQQDPDQHGPVLVQGERDDLVGFLPPEAARAKLALHIRPQLEALEQRGTLREQPVEGVLVQVQYGGVVDGPDRDVVRLAQDEGGLAEERARWERLTFLYRALGVDVPGLQLATLDEVGIAARLPLLGDDLTGAAVLPLEQLGHGSEILRAELSEQGDLPEPLQVAGTHRVAWSYCSIVGSPGEEVATSETQRSGGKGRSS